MWSWVQENILRFMQKGGLFRRMGILSKVRGTKLGYRLGRAVLESKIVNGSKTYQRLYNQRIQKSIKKLEAAPPSIVEIGITNACNSNCIMCPHSLLKEIGTMKMGLYRKIIDNCSRLKIKSVTLSFFGEPLLDPTLIEKVKYAKSKNMRVVFFSNASLLTERWAYDLINSGLDGINISFDAYTKETYEKIRKGLKFDIVKKNIENLIRIRNKLGRKNPSICLIFVEMNENKKEIKDFYKDWKKKVESINLLNMRNWAGGIEKNSSNSFHCNKRSTRVPCALLWQKMMVDWNGDVVLCCDDWDHAMVLGNLKNQTIEEVWKGEKLKNIRKLHVKREFEKIPKCSVCNKKTVWWL